MSEYSIARVWTCCPLLFSEGKRPPIIYSLLMIGFFRFLGAMVVLDFDGAIGAVGRDAFFPAQTMYFELGLLILGALLLIPFRKFSPGVRMWLIRVSFAVALALMVLWLFHPATLQRHSWGIELLGLKLDAALWIALFLLPGLSKAIGEYKTPWSIFYLLGGGAFIIALLLYAHLRAFCWFSATCMLLLFIAHHRLGSSSEAPRRHLWTLRATFIMLLLPWLLLSFSLLFEVTGPVSYSRLSRSFAAWMPQSAEKMKIDYRAWRIQQSFINGGLVGAGSPLPEGRIVEEGIVKFPLYIVSYRFGFLGVLGTILMSLFLAFEWLRYALNTKNYLWHTGLSLFLMLHIFCNVLRTTGLFPLLPSLAFPLLSYGGNFTLWSFVCLGFLLQDDLRGCRKL